MLNQPSPHCSITKNSLSISQSDTTFVSHDETEEKSKETTTNDRPLPQFTADDMIRTITKWFQNDIDYKKHRSQTINIFANHHLSGHKMIILSGEDAMRIVKDEMLEFMTLETLNIMFDGFNKWKERDLETLQSKSTEDIAHNLFEYPLQQLITRIKTQPINGETFIDSVHKTNIIRQETGWNDDEIEQIHLVICKAMVLTEDVFKHKIRNVLKANKSDCDGDDIPNALLDRIEKILNKHDVEQLQYNMKHNKNTQTFNDQVLRLVKDLKPTDGDNLIQRVFSTIARCFAFDCSDELDLEETRQWICSHCGNYNFSKYIDGK
eukprot:904274_1